MKYSASDPKYLDPFPFLHGRSTSGWNSAPPQDLTNNDARHKNPTSHHHNVSDAEVSMHSWELQQPRGSRNQKPTSTEARDDMTTLGTKIPRHVSTGVNDTGTSVKSVSIRRHTTPAEASIRFDAFVLSVAAYLSER